MTSFAVNYDYRCPFARIAHMHLLDGLEAGAGWDVTFMPFSLGQVHVAEGGTDVWDAPETDTGLLALQVSVVVRDQYPHAFQTVHRRLFDLRHVESKDLNDRDEIGKVLVDAGLDPESIWAEIEGGAPLQQVRAEHEAAASEASAWGVPTFMVGGDGVFVRLMETANGDGDLAIRTVERVVDMLTGWPQLNEFKHTSIRR
jgi:protein-disulfide isomerase-like protein with CxxC motif